MATRDSFTRYAAAPIQIGETFWNLSGDVGPTNFGSYQREDVQLVQVLLKMVDENPSGSSSLNFFPGQPKPEKKIVAADGVFGPITRSWVEWFQANFVGHVDHAVSKPPLGRSIGLKSGQRYSIFPMNDMAFNADPARHTNLITDFRTPVELRKMLAKSPPAPGPRRL